MTDVLNHSEFPTDVKAKLEELETSLLNGKVTTKGYCKQKWIILEPHAPCSLAKQIQLLQEKLESTRLSETEYYNQMMKCLDCGFCLTKLEEDTADDESVQSDQSDKCDREIREVENGSDEMKNDCNDTNSSGESEHDNRVCHEEATSGSSSNGKDVEKEAKQEKNPILELLSKTRHSRLSGPNTQPCTPLGLKKICGQTAENNFNPSATASCPKKGAAQNNIKQMTITSMFTKMSNKRKSDEGLALENGLHEEERNVKELAVVQISIDKEKTEAADMEMHFEKKVKLEDDDPKPAKKKKVLSPCTPQEIPSKCQICRQILDDPDLVLYQGHPDNSVEESVALTDPKLSLFTGDEADIHEHDQRPQNKVTYFSVYDKAGHLCPFDVGLIERNVLLYFSGYMKAIYEENPDPEGGIPTKDIGPINEWWVAGFDGGEKALLGFSTSFGEYYLMEPSESYAPFMKKVNEKICISKTVIEFLLEDNSATYEDLLNRLQTVVPPAGLTMLTEDNLLHHAQFVCDQVLSFDNSAGDIEDLLITSPCMRALVKMSGVTFSKRVAMRQADRNTFKIPKTQWSRAATTPLVEEVFEMFFPEQLDKDESKAPRRRRCGVCEACQLPDCGTCVSCRDMVKFGGAGRNKQCCVQRRCPNMAIQEADDSDMEDSEESLLSESARPDISFTGRPKGIRFREKRDVRWLGDPIKVDSRRKFFDAVMVNGEEIRCNDCIMVEPLDPSQALYIARVMYLFENKAGAKLVHGCWFSRGCDTVLGETADPVELFVIDQCEDFDLSAVVRKATVIQKVIPNNWAKMGGLEVSHEHDIVDDGKTFSFQQLYDWMRGRFEDLPADPPCPREESKYWFCVSCERLNLEAKYLRPYIDEKLGITNENSEVLYGVVRLRGEEYRVGTSVFLRPGSFKFKTSAPVSVTKKDNSKDQKVDEEVYPEFYRKSTDHVKGSNVETPEPFCVGHIKTIFVKSAANVTSFSDIWIRVNKFYRPENTHRGPLLSQQVDLNMLYWSEEECVLNLSQVVGKCYVVFSENLDVLLTEWTSRGPHRFYFSQAYNSIKQTYEEPPVHAMNIGNQGKGKGKGKGKSKKTQSEMEEKKKTEVKIVDWPQIHKRLRSLDVFAGCGGLSEGLHQSGISDSCWAIEKDEAAAHAFRLNNPGCTVFTDDCNELLKLAMNGESTNDRGQLLPRKGEVELLCGGPPCQGFSGMNRFNSRQYSLFKNSLIVSYLSYCDFYRPRFFILENVRNFVSFKRSMVLKLTLRCLQRMGYQCTFGVLQAGNYGVPQTRRRAIILAAAPGEILPIYPEPTHVFNPKASQLSVMVDDKKFMPSCRWTTSAPLRTITVRDAMSDLPEIRNGHKREEIAYGGDPMSHFQRLIRGNQYQPVLRDHICKDMAPLIEARIAHIPTASGSDWRDLPNIVVRLSDGTFTKKLQYFHHDKKNGKSSTGGLRGVCVCASGKACDPMDRQHNTLIPWCLPHTSNRHNQWAGLYGRLEWDGFFSTTVTNPEPMGKQGRVLHPEQTRVVSVRECARSQGFPDTYRFFGTILDKHRQIGNAVPPPVGAAIGFEIRKCVSAVEERRKAQSEMEII